VQADVDRGLADGVTGTPTFFINGQRVAGFKTVEEMRTLLDAAIAAAE
jgi:protein-disulfide isomerase